MNIPETDYMIVHDARTARAIARNRERRRRLEQPPMLPATIRARPLGPIALGLWLRGHDTAGIARRLSIAEATAYNILARAREEARSGA